MIDVTDYQEIKPWERQPGESEKAFSYFITYREMGRNHSLRTLCRQEGVGMRQIWGYSKKWRWVERCAAWQDELDRIKREVIIKEVQEMTKRHSQQAMMFQRVLIMPVEAVIKKLKQNSPEIAEFEGAKLKDLFNIVLDSAKLFSSVVDIERKSRGEPNEILKQDVTSEGQRIKVILPPGAYDGNNEEFSDFEEEETAKPGDQQNDN